jgi:hypothetical protein
VSPAQLRREPGDLLRLCIEVARRRLIRNKAIGIALVNLTNFKTAKDYVATVKRKGIEALHCARHDPLTP